MKIFRERDFLADTVDGRTGRKDKAVDAGVARRFGLEQKVRLVPGGTSVRRGAYLAPGVIVTDTVIVAEP